jgi:hypothetical protein
MKNKLIPPAALFAVAAAAITAAPLTVTTAVHTKPDTSSPAVSYLKAGTDPVPAPGSVASTPAGWMAIELPGPFEGYVENKDLAKSLDVKPGAQIRLAPKPEAGVLAVAGPNDKTTITGIHGKWTQISLERNLTGYIHLGGTAGYLPPIATSPATSTPPPANPAPLAPPPVAPGIYGVATPGQPSPMVNLGDGGSSTLPRQYAGRFVSTRRPFAPRRPYDYALNDDAGRRFAYLDTSKLLLTDQIEKYLNLSVVVFGTAKNSADGKDIVIQIETLQLK